ncbi:MAG: S-adenosylmethionine:tRNA ribosyltransferase-isomerase, partial [Methylocystis sp.]
MRVDLFDFNLPQDSIALRPADPRDSARMLVALCGGLFEDRIVRDLPNYLRPGDALVVNDSRVIHARLSGRRFRDALSANVEATLIERLDASRWRALMRPAKKLAIGDRICFMGHGRAIDAHVEAKGEDGEITLVFELQGPALDIAIEQAGVMPLPPYIAGKRSADARDESDYQTIFAREAGAVAAPTAGLHFTPQLLAAIEARGARLYRVTLHVGAGTFLPVKAED